MSSQVAQEEEEGEVVRRAPFDRAEQAAVAERETRK